MIMEEGVGEDRSALLINMNRYGVSERVRVR